MQTPSSTTDLTAADLARRADMAQDLVYGAWQLTSKAARIRRARKALELWPDCADAWSILGDNLAGTAREAILFYEEAVRAGARALGPSQVWNAEGGFWARPETQPYMRARLSLALAQRALALRQEATEHLFEMLRLNPNDDQGVRVIAVLWLLEERRDDQLAQLFRTYAGDALCDMLYGEALWTFRQHGETRKAAAALRRALEGNAHVPGYLLGRSPLPDVLAEIVAVGSDEEAASYSADWIAVWRDTPGALEWLARTQAALQPSAEHP
jgi:tetratricopeptide (TPR) repeat protein